MDKTYKELPLELEEAQRIKEVKKNLEGEPEKLEELKVALHRFTVRWLFSMKVTNENVLSDWTAEEQFWINSRPYFESSDIQ